ncbi:sensor histidine kinase [Algoriphagus formosus]|jgi:signal transduction histidine kinase|uniref:histidine kinase n=1 Tax=Algoriphagus formosus TaxID=2007308 RepID=A0A4R5V1P5_9BACT|nr:MULTISPECIES: sensor histidine kinase [Algoriphagus]TDK45511.1 sensor histidine kinase [Algoriphagus aquimaris]
MGGEDNQIIFILFAGAFLAAIMATFVVSMVILHRQRQVQNKQKMDQIKAEYEKTLLNIENEIQQDTLRHIGRELHDNVGQLLSLAKLYLGSSKPEKQTEGRLLINQIINEVRGLSKTLNLDWVESISLEEFIKQQLDKIQATDFCETLLVESNEAWKLNKDTKLVLIRVIQECLNNAIKHASPSNIKVQMKESDGRYLVRIEDDGKGFDTSQQSKGSGMTNLRKRMETIGGAFEIISSPGNGTQINLSLPVSVLVLN